MLSFVKSMVNHKAHKSKQFYLILIPFNQVQILIFRFSEILYNIVITYRPARMVSSRHVRKIQSPDLLCDA
jgi:hypothetical protein